LEISKPAGKIEPIQGRKGGLKVPKLFLPQSPCRLCSRLVFETSTFVFEGGTRTVETESCSVVSDSKEFYRHRRGVEVDGEIKFPWCAYLKRRAS